MSLAIEQRYRDAQRLWLSVEGQIDQYTYDMLDAELADAIDQGICKIYLDLSSVSYISSAGIGVLIGTSSKLNEVALGTLELISPTPPVMHIFDSMGFSGMFTIIQKAPEDLVGQQSEKAMDAHVSALNSKCP